jgi:hypothetical protein
MPLDLTYAPWCVPILDQFASSDLTFCNSQAQLMASDDAVTSEVVAGLDLSSSKLTFRCRSHEKSDSTLGNFGSGQLVA